MQLQITFVMIGKSLWTKFPRDRAFADLLDDALAIERRISKAVDLDRERSRYKHICDWIESNALLCSNETGSFSMENASFPKALDYLSLIEQLSEQQVPRQFKPDPAQPCERPWHKSVPIGMGFYVGENSISEQLAIFESVASDLASFVHDPSKSIEQVANAKVEAYKKFRGSAKAIFEVVSLV